MPRPPALTDSAVFNTGGFSETLGALTLTVATTTAHIDLGTGASVLHFADSSAATWSGFLEIDEWSGSPAGGGPDELFFGSTSSGLTGGQFADITFTIRTALPPALIARRSSPPARWCRSPWCPSPVRWPPS